MQGHIRLLYNTQAIVLNKHNYGDTSLICNLFTLEQGKICIIAKGARSIKNPNSAILQPLNFIQLIYYYKNRRNIQTLKEASILNKHFHIDENYDTEYDILKAGMILVFNDIGIETTYSWISRDVNEISLKLYLWEFRN